MEGSKPSGIGIKEIYQQQGKRIALKGEYWGNPSRKTNKAKGERGLPTPLRGDPPV